MAFALVVCDTLMTEAHIERSKGIMMSKSSKVKKERKPIVLSKDEALYPPEPRSLKLALGAIAVGIIVIIVFLVMYPPF